jgi:hypothetical protein
MKSAYKILVGMSAGKKQHGRMVDVSVIGRIMLKLIMVKENLRVLWAGFSYLQTGSWC